MPLLEIELADPLGAFSPGETITGTATWQLDAAPRVAELHLVWNTRGKGTTDIEVVQTISFTHPQARDTRPFTIKLPDAPYTFSGQLISLLWNLELNLEPGDHCRTLEIIVAPGGKEVLLPRIRPTR
jgi:hypothetical protein